MEGGRLFSIEGTLLINTAGQIRLRVKNPSVGRASIEQGLDGLRRVANVDVRDVSVIIQVLLEDVSLNLMAILVDRAVGNI